MSHLMKTWKTAAVIRPDISDVNTQFEADWKQDSLLRTPRVLVSQSSMLLLLIWNKVIKMKGTKNEMRADATMGMICRRRGYAN